MSRTKSAFSKVILKSLSVGGEIAIATATPIFAKQLVPRLIKEMKYKHKSKKRKEESDKMYNSFYYLHRNGLLKMEYRSKQLHVSLTKEGRIRARKYSLDDLKIEKPKRWDKKWRVLIFDIEEKHRMRRDAFRGKLKELGLFQLQKSVWVCPYHFQKEVAVMKQFFSLKSAEMTTFIATEIEYEAELKNFFNIE